MDAAFFSVLTKNRYICARREDTMNIRKQVNYRAMFETLNALMASTLPQMELYCEIGRLVSSRPEKGAAVAASEYMQCKYPDVSGLSPRNLRRMREFYRTYDSTPEVLAEAMTIGWTQNVVILEAELTLQERVWYIRAAGQFSWSKLELQRQLKSCAHLKAALDFPPGVYCTEKNSPEMEQKSNDKDTFYLPQQYMPESNGRVCRERLGKKTGLESQFHIESVATSAEEIGNPVYPPARRKLAEPGIGCAGKTARQLRNEDYDQLDLLIGMNKVSLRNMYRICGGDFDGKLHLLMEFAGPLIRNLQPPGTQEPLRSPGRMC